RLAAALIWFIRMRLQPGVLRVCLRTLRIISRDRKALAPLITDYAILTLARLGGISALPTWPEEEEAEWGSSHSDVTPENETETHQNDNNGSNTQHPTCYRERDDSPTCVCVSAACAESSVCEGGVQNITSNCNIGRETQNDHYEEHVSKDGVCGLLARGKKDAKGEKDEEEEEWYDDGEVWRKEAMKTLCNVIYNSPKAQERASIL
ncbi:hypothetical protein M9458_006280, partial [Cirrhinus mrigala]